jgi:POT family proton-dependent oligopeptide transporter
MPLSAAFIVGNEAAERFSYYGIRSILAVYITGEVVRGGLGQTKDTATTIIHLFIFANYFLPLLGAWLSDRLIGRYWTILSLSLVYCLGNGVLACSDLLTTVDAKLACLAAGLGLIALGSGGIKPCVSAFMGDQFKPEQGHLLQKAYGAFYWAINFGSFFSFLVVPWVKDHHGYGWAFGVPGVFMALATLIFWLGTRHYTRVAPARETKTAGFLKVLLGAFRSQPRLTLAPILNVLTSLVLPLVAMMVFTALALVHDLTPVMRGIGWAALAAVGCWYLLIVGLSLTGRLELPDNYWNAARPRFSEGEISAARSVSPILFVFALVPVFWALFDQTTSTWVLQGTAMVPVEVFGFVISAEEMQSANPAIVMILVPLLTLLVYPRLGRLATPLRRMGAGMFFAAASYVIVAWLQHRLEAGEKLSILWQVLPYLVLTTGEVLLSTTGLEFAFAEAAPGMRSTIMSFWLLTVAFGNLLVTAITKVLGGGALEAGSVTSGRFLLYAVLTAVVGVLFSVVATRYRYRHPTFRALAGEQ